MAGLAKTNRFMLGTATVMLGPVADLFDLTPADHSIGLVKNFTMSSEPAYTELTQGVKNTIVFSVLTSNPVRASMEVYEFTGKNIAYGLGLDGSEIEAQTASSTVDTPIDGTSSPEDEVVLDTGGGTNFSIGDWIQIAYGTNDDQKIIRKITNKSTDTLTVAPAIGIVVPADSVVKKVNIVDIGSKDEQPFLAAKVVGILADGTPQTILIPKVRITKGFNLAFQSDNYGNLPYEFTVYDLVDTDTFYSTFGGASAKLATLA